LLASSSICAYSGRKAPRRAEMSLSLSTRTTCQPRCLARSLASLICRSTPFSRPSGSWLIRAYTATLDTPWDVTLFLKSVNPNSENGVTPVGRRYHARLRPEYVQYTGLGGP